MRNGYRRSGIQIPLNWNSGVVFFFFLPTPLDALWIPLSIFLSPARALSLASCAPPHRTESLRLLFPHARPNPSLGSPLSDVGSKLSASSSLAQLNSSAIRLPLLDPARLLHRRTPLPGAARPPLRTEVFVSLARDVLFFLGLSTRLQEPAPDLPLPRSPLCTELAILSSAPKPQTFPLACVSSSSRTLETFARFFLLCTEPKLGYACSTPPSAPKPP